MTKIWMLEKYDYCDGWKVDGLFSTKENAELAVSHALSDEDMGHDPEDFRIDWLPVDMVYDMGCAGEA